MTDQTPFQKIIVRRAFVKQSLGWSNTTLHNRIKEGLFPPPFSLGGTSVGWLNTEVELIQNMLVAGKKDAEIKVAVVEIVTNRAF